MKKTIISVMLLVGLIISPTSAFAAQIYSADAILTPSAGNLMGGLGCFVGGEVPGQYDWTIGNCVPGGTPTDDMVFSTKDTTGWQERMRITKEGNIGIGTTEPAAKLDIIGDVKASGTIVGKGIIRIVSQVVLPGDTTTVEFQLLPDRRYILDAEIANNPAAGAGWIGVYFDGDYVTTNYSTQRTKASGSSLTTAKYNDPYVLYLDSHSRANLVYEIRVREWW
ncbi:MAG: hypothetical protein AB1422_18485 [bacterium]